MTMDTLGFKGRLFPSEVRRLLPMPSMLSWLLTITQELASTNHRTMSRILWAYPNNPEDLFPYDETGETSKKLFVDAGYKYDAEKKIDLS